MTPNFLMRNLLLASVLAMPLSVKAAGIPVIDSSNLTQAIQQVVADGTKIANQVSQIANQVQQINQLAQTLQTVGTGEFAALATQLSGQITGIQSNLGSLSSISYDLANVKSQFRAKFPEISNIATIASTALDGMRGQWTQQLDDVVVEALRAQSVTSRLQQYNTAAQQMLTQSHSGHGEVRQLQALNQMMGVLIQQMSDMSQLLAANSRVTSIAIAQQNAEMEAARQAKIRLRTNYTSRGAPVAVTPLPNL